MKVAVFLSLVCLLAFVPVGRASEELSELSNQKMAAVERAVSPINTRYVEELEKLVKLLTTSGDLESAVTVNSEIERVKNEPLKVVEMLETVPRLVILSEQRASAIERALEPVNQVYKEQIQQRFEASRRAGNLDDALAFEKELDRIRAKDGETKAVSDVFSKETLIGTVWGAEDSGDRNKLRVDADWMRVLLWQADGSYIEGHYRNWSVHDAKRREISIDFHSGTEELKVDSRISKMANGKRVMVRFEELEEK